MIAPAEPAPSTMWLYFIARCSGWREESGASRRHVAPFEASDDSTRQPAPADLSPTDSVPKCVGDLVRRVFRPSPPDRTRHGEWVETASPTEDGTESPDAPHQRASSRPR